MRRVLMSIPVIVSLAILSAIPGCGSASDSGKPKEVTGGPPSTVPLTEHDHPSEGPHHGSLIELGNEEYHAELVHDEKAGTVTIYILDSKAEKAVPIEAAELMINLKHDGQPEQFPLKAEPQEGDPADKSSRFVSKDAELGEDLDHKGADPQLSVNIDGKSYIGKIAHDHDHAHKHD